MLLGALSLERFINQSNLFYLMVNIYTYLEIFSDDANKQVSLSELEKYFKRPHQTIKSHLDQLLKSKVLLEDKRERFLFYKLNLDNPLTYEYLAICEKQRLFRFLKKELFHRLYLELRPYFHNTQILLFGSSTNTNDYSDIDILLITKDHDIRECIKKFELRYSIKIHPTITQESILTKTFIKELRKKHIIFNAHDYFVNLLYK